MACEVFEKYDMIKAENFFQQCYGLIRTNKPMEIDI